MKAVIFDFFGVLSTEGFTQFCDSYFPHDRSRRQQAVELVTRHDAGVTSKEEYITGLAELAGVAQDIVREHMQRNKPNALLLEYIREKLKPIYKIGLLSNAGDDYVSQILGFETSKLFDDIVLSYRYRIVKPQAEIYELAAERLGVLTTECVMVDDSPSHCAGAKRVGMKPVLYQNFSQLKEELSEILAASADH